MIFYPPGSGAIISPASLVLANYHLSNDTSNLDQFVNFFFKDRCTSPSDYKVISSENSTLDGLIAKRFTMYDYDKGPKGIKGRKIRYGSF